MESHPSKPVIEVHDQEAFAACLADLAASPVIALDTEFIKTRTFYPKLGLLQLADAHRCYLIDPLALGSIAAVKPLLEDTGKTIVIHSAREDLNLLLTQLDCLPAQLFDTQLAAAYCDLGDSLSYHGLVHRLLGITLAKDETRSDWLRRPLSAAQLRYAALDVMYLHELMADLTVRLDSANRQGWLAQDCAALLRLASASEAKAQWPLAYAAVDQAWQLTDSELATLQQLAYWRESRARERDLPRGWIAKDEDLTALARWRASHLEDDPDPTRCPGLGVPLLRHHRRALRDLLLQPLTGLPAVDRHLVPRPLNAGWREKVKLCQAAVKAVASQLDLSPTLLGSKRQLIALLQAARHHGEEAWPGEFEGWREEYLAPALLPHLEGELPP